MKHSNKIAAEMMENQITIQMASSRNEMYTQDQTVRIHIPPKLFFTMQGLFKSTITNIHNEALPSI